MAPARPSLTNATLSARSWRWPLSQRAATTSRARRPQARRRGRSRWSSSDLHPACSCAWPRLSLWQLSVSRSPQFVCGGHVQQQQVGGGRRGSVVLRFEAGAAWAVRPAIGMGRRRRRDRMCDCGCRNPRLCVSNLVGWWRWMFYIDIERGPYCIYRKNTPEREPHTKQSVWQVPSSFVDRTYGSHIQQHSTQTQAFVLSADAPRQRALLVALLKL